MKFMYIGEGETEAFGIKFKAGEAVDVTDETAIRTLKHNHPFTHSEAPAAPKAKPPPPPAAREIDLGF